MATYTALIDANVLYSIPVTDLLLELASTGLYRVRWSDDIHDEWVNAVIKTRPDLPEKAIKVRRERMDKAIPQARVTGHREIIDSLKLPDPDDRHVLAAAIVGRADVVVTYNLNDFPEEALTPYGIEVQHPDEFLNHQRTLNETSFIQCVKEIRGRLSQPKYSADEYIATLRKCHLQIIASELTKVQALI